jgi:hypothetical protein
MPKKVTVKRVKPKKIIKKPRKINSITVTNKETWKSGNITRKKPKKLDTMPRSKSKKRKVIA